MDENYEIIHAWQAVVHVHTPNGDQNVYIQANTEKDVVYQEALKTLTSITFEKKQRYGDKAMIWMRMEELWVVNIPDICAPRFEDHLTQSIMDAVKEPIEYPRTTPDWSTRDMVVDSTPHTD